MIEVFSSYSRAFYDKNRSPKESADSPGINCLTLAYDSSKEILGRSLDEVQEEFTGKLVMENKVLFADVPNSGPFVMGDIFLFGPEGLTDYHKLHLAVFSGEYDNDDVPLLYHATNYSLFQLEQPDAVFITRLTRMLKQRQWQVLYGVRRPISQEPDSPLPEQR